MRAAREAVKVEEAGGLVDLAENAGRVETKAGTQAALDSLAVAEEPQDMARLARLSAAKGGKTRAIIKLLGRAAIVLTATHFRSRDVADLGRVRADRLLCLVQNRRRAHDAARLASQQSTPPARGGIADTGASGAAVIMVGPCRAFLTTG